MSPAAVERVVWVLCRGHRYLWLNNNHLAGTIPDGVSALTKLTFVMALQRSWLLVRWRGVLCVARAPSAQE